MASSRINPYLAAFPDFTPNPHASVISEFKRLARTESWKSSKQDYRSGRRKYLMSEYDLNLGNLDKAKKLEEFQRLCQKLRTRTIPDSVRQCRKALKTEVHVNLISLIDDLRGVGQVEVFGSRAELQEYTQRTGKYFPREGLKEKDLLKILLRVLV